MQEALDEKLAELFVLFTEGEMSEVSTTTIRMLSEDIPHAPLVRYLNLIARADQIWDISYDYTRIRGMVWMALEGLAEAAKSHPILSDGLAWFARGYLAYTACEGGFISNDLPRLARHARQAHASFSKARDALEPLEHEAAEALREDIEGRLAYFDGLALYAETLAALLDGTLEDGQLAGVLEVLDGFLVAVEAYDPELSSELRAHRLFLEQHGEHTASAPPLILDAEVVLGVCAYVDDDLMKRLNDDILNDPDFGEPALSEWLSVSLQGALRTEALQDIFETALGEENMHASVFQLGEMRSPGVQIEGSRTGARPPSRRGEG